MATVVMALWTALNWFYSLAAQSLAAYAGLGLLAASGFFAFAHVLARIDALQGQLKAISQMAPERRDVSFLRAELDALSERSSRNIAALSTRVTELSQKVPGLADLLARVAALAQQVDDVTEHAIAADVVSLSARMDALSSLSSRVDALSSALSSRVDDLSDLSSRVDDLSASVPNTSALEANVELLTIRLSAIERSRATGRTHLENANRSLRRWNLRAGQEFDFVARDLDDFEGTLVAALASHMHAIHYVYLNAPLLGSGDQQVASVASGLAQAEQAAQQFAGRWQGRFF